MVTEEQIDKVLALVKGELMKATALHGSMKSAHEGYAVILEEVDELWDEVKADRGYHSGAQREALQIAAMGARYVLDITLENNNDE